MAPENALWTTFENALWEAMLLMVPPLKITLLEAILLIDPPLKIHFLFSGAGISPSRQTPHFQ